MTTPSQHLIQAMFGLTADEDGNAAGIAVFAAAPPGQQQPTPRSMILTCTVNLPLVSMSLYAAGGIFSVGPPETFGRFEVGPPEYPPSPEHGVGYTGVTVSIPYGMGLSPVSALNHREPHPLHGQTFVLAPNIDFFVMETYPPTPAMILAAFAASTWQSMVLSAGQGIFMIDAAPGGPLGRAEVGADQGLQDPQELAVDPPFYIAFVEPGTSDDTRLGTLTLGEAVL